MKGNGGPHPMLRFLCDTVIIEESTRLVSTIYLKALARRAVMISEPEVVKHRSHVEQFRVRV